MVNYKLVKKIISGRNDIAKASEFIKHGLMYSEIIGLCKSGKLMRIKHGYYKLAGKDEPNDEKILAALFSDGILCMDSALFYYEYSDRTPLEWTLAFSRDVSRSRFKIDSLCIKPYFVDKKYLDIGVVKNEINKTMLKIYDRERVICDCFKYKNKMDSEMFNKAINAYVKDNDRNLGNLSAYAKKMRVYKKVSEVIGVLA